MKEAKRVCGWFVALAAAFFAAALPYIERFRLPLGAAAGIYACFVLMLALALVPGVVELRPALGRWIEGRRGLVLPAVWCVPYLIYAFGTGDFRWAAIARLLVAGAIPVVVYTLAPVRALWRFGWQDWLVAVWLIAIPMGQRLGGIWNVPVNLDFLGRLFLVAVGAWSWVFLRPVPEPGYALRFSRRMAAAAGRNFVYFAALAIPGGLALGFTAWNPRFRGWEDFLAAFLEIFFFVALLEELFFRVFLQTLVAGSLGSQRKGRIFAACVFGLFHILHAPFPNWRYVILASVAGWFYGAAFTEGGGVAGGALTHALVDTVWRTFFLRN